ncbi:alpha/beta fold hydrolase [Roseateles sp. P5_E4]
MTTLVLLPGMDGTGKLFQPLIRELPADWRVIVLSYPADARLGYEELTSLARAALPPSGPLVLLGESFSGPVAIQLASELGPRVQALILCCTFVRNPRPGLSWLSRFMGGLPSPASMPAVVSSRVMLGGQAPAESRKLLAQALAALPAAVLRARLKAVMKVDVIQQLMQVRAPVLYLQARQDLLVPRDVAMDLQRALPSLQFVGLEGPHGLLQATPRAAAAAVRAFLEQGG